MFSVIVSEKGGAERREVFDRTEINVGRVQGNDLMLPKGNVSKRHARLLFRDGRFIITDLKSTNGTYVNGRKIAQATIVREGDKIYIGDFILRVEAAAATAAPPAPEGGPAGPLHTHQEPQDSSAAPVLEPPDLIAGPSLELPHAPLPPPPPSSAERGLALPGQIDLARTGGQVISHFPLENDPDESVEAVVPGPPRVPSPRPATIQALSPTGTQMTPAPPAARPSTTTLQAQTRSTPVSPGISLGHPLDRGTPREPLAGPGTGAPPTSSSISTSSFQAVSPRRGGPPGSERGDRLQAYTEAVQAAARLSALGRLVDRVAAAVDLRALDSLEPLGSLEGGAAPDEVLARRVEAAVGEAVAAMRAAGDLPAEVDADALAGDARRELLQLGPLEALLNADDVLEIRVFRHDHVVARYSRRSESAEVGFSSEEAVGRVIRRLCALSGEPLREGERTVERRLPRGARLFAVLPPAASNGHALIIHRPQRSDSTLDDLVRSGTVSRGMAGLLAQCVGARANILVVGARGSGAVALLGALTAAGGPDEHVAVIQDEDELLLPQPHVISFSPGMSAAPGAAGATPAPGAAGALGEGPDAAARAVKTAARLGPDRLVVRSAAGRVAAEIVEAIGEGASGVIAGSRAPALRQALARLAADIVAARPGLTLEAAREQLASSFHLAIEVARLRDGRSRVLRVAELAVEGGHLTARDVFTFSVERTAAGGALEGSFHPSGVVPAIVEDLASRGVTVDTGALRRTR